MVEGNKPHQLRFSPDILDQSEPFPIGLPASGVYCGLLTRRSVCRYAVTSYTPGFAYKHDQLQAVYWQDGMPTEEELDRLSQKFRVGDVFKTEDLHIDLRKILGACSLVEVNREKLHIPMLDFVIEVKPDSLLVVKESVRLPKGVFLNSGNSYHYYGYDLMSELQWRAWMSGLGNGKLDEIIDESYLSYSLKRGYGALRLFGYPDTDKATVPTVVGYA